MRMSSLTVECSFHVAPLSVCSALALKLNDMLSARFRTNWSEIGLDEYNGRIHQRISPNVQRKIGPQNRGRNAPFLVSVSNIISNQNRLEMPSHHSHFIRFVQLFTTEAVISRLQRQRQLLPGGSYGTCLGNRTIRLRSRLHCRTPVVQISCYLSRCRAGVALNVKPPELRECFETVTILRTYALNMTYGDNATTNAKLT